MTRPISLLVPGIAVALTLCCSLLNADDAKPKSISLFNGQDLSGWTGVFNDPKVKTEDVFTVRDGVIHDVGHPGGYIRTNDDYTNFVLHVKWRFIKPGNSGVLIRVQPPDKVWPKSVECQLNSGDAGDIWDIDQYPLKTDPARVKGRRTVKLQPSSEKPIGEWNEYEITADGTNLTLKVNGVFQNQATDFQVLPGKILLQAEGADIEFKDIMLTPLP